MESIYEIMQRRQSDRAYDPSRKVEREKTERIIAAARLAPSACKRHCRRPCVYGDEQVRRTSALLHYRGAGIAQFHRTSRRMD